MNKKLLIGLVGTTLLSLSIKHPLSAQATNNNCQTEAECNQIIQSAKDELSVITGKEETIQQEIDLIEADISTIYNQIETTQTKITNLITEIRAVEAEIIVNENKLEELEEEITALKQVVNERMRVSQRLSRKNTLLTMISESTSMIDFIKQLSAINRFAEQDEENMKQLKELVTQQQLILSNLNEQKKTLATNKARLEIEQTNLQSAKAALEKKKAKLAKDLQALENERLSAAEILKIAEQQKQYLVQQTSGGFMIPLKTGYVSCEYGCYTRADGIKHEGIDLGNYGNTSTPVVASAAGTVIRSGWHSAYGNHVMISHNINGKIMTTVYGHMHKYPLVSVGQTVSKGQQLGTMGNTGNSQGAHLHFEIYEGYYNWPHSVNPRKYINFPSRW